MDPIATPAPAQVESAEPKAPTALEASVITGNLSAFREAKHAERVGKPLEADQSFLDRIGYKPTTEATDGITDTPAPEAAAGTEPKLSKRQQDINERIRVSTEKATADLRAENARLLAQISKPATPAPRREAPQAPPTTLADTVQRPEVDKPILGEVDFYTKFPDATGTDYARYVAKYDRLAEGAVTEQASRQQREQQYQTERTTKFHERLATARAADPEFAKKLSPEVYGLKPYAAEPDGTPFTVDHAIAEEIIDSDVPDGLMLHLSANPADLAKLRAASSPKQLNRILGRLEAKLEAPASAQGHTQPKTVTDAPDPGSTLGKKPAQQVDPVDAAVAGRNFTRYREERRAERIAQRAR